jgi:hypothetical protein
VKFRVFSNTLKIVPIPRHSFHFVSRGGSELDDKVQISLNGSSNSADINSRSVYEFFSRKPFTDEYLIQSLKQ